MKHLLGYTGSNILTIGQYLAPAGVSANDFRLSVNAWNLDRIQRMIAKAPDYLTQIRPATLVGM